VASSAINAEAHQYTTGNKTSFFNSDIMTATITGAG